MLLKPVLMSAFNNKIDTVKIIGRVFGRSKDGHVILRNCEIVHGNNRLGVEEHIWLNRIAARRIPTTMPRGTTIVFTAKLRPYIKKDGSKSIRIEDPVIEEVRGWLGNDVKLQ